MFAPHQRESIILSDIGIVLWLAGIAGSIYTFGFSTVFRLYLAPYLWVNHWLVLITFLQHTDPLLPHYRASEFTFPRGALATLDRTLLGGCGSIMGWIGGHATHGISETHVLHHVSSKIPHYNAWEASDALRKRLEQAGIKLEGAPGGWGEVYRVFKECKVSLDLLQSDIYFKMSFSLSRMKATFFSTRILPVSLPPALRSLMVALMILVLRLTRSKSVIEIPVDRPLGYSLHYDR
jgi:omega-6 fatty acid desaturase (delta-12 desaturase)